MVCIGFERVKYKLYGLILLLVVSLFMALCVAGYSQAFTPVSVVYLRAERAGLQMYSGNRVQLRGVDVGEVGDVRSNGSGGVELALNMEPDKLDSIPSNVDVQLSQLTAFGAKTVQLVDPKNPARGGLQPNAVLQTGRETVEVNDLLDKLGGVLNAAQPAKVSTVLGALSQTLDGRGQQLGETAVKLTDYLRRFNANLPALQQDFRRTGQVADVYADVTPELASLLNNARFTSRTLVDQQAQLDSFLVQLTRFGNTGDEFFRTNGEALASVSNNALPTSQLLKKYSPEFHCFISGVAELDRRTLTQQGNTVPGFVGNTTLEPGTDPYQYPQERPVMGADNGPDCNGLPYIHGDDIPPSIMKDVDKGGEPNPAPSTNRLQVGNQALVAQLFGPLATLPALPADPTHPAAPGSSTDTEKEGR